MHNLSYTEATVAGASAAIADGCFTENPESILVGEQPWARSLSDEQNADA